MTGHAALRARFAGLFGRIASLAHRLVDVWEGDDGVVVSEDVSIWTLPDGQVIEIQSCGVFTVRDGRFVTQHVYADTGPVDRALAGGLTPALT